MNKLAAIGWLVVMMGVVLSAPARGESGHSFEAFARGVDASSLRLAPVLEGGRVGGFGIFSRGLWGRIGVLESHPFGGDEAFLSPEEGVLTLLFTPDRLEDYPLIKVDAPLYPGLASGEVVTIHEADALLTEHATTLDPAMRRALGKLDERMQLLARVHGSTPRMVWTGSEWEAPDAPGTDSAMQQVWNDLRSAWVAQDAESVNIALRELGELLEAPAADVSARWRRELEWVLHEWEVWWWSVAWFGAVALLWMFAGVRETSRLRCIALSAHVVGVLLLALTVAARGTVAERLPVQNQFEAMVMLALGIALVGVVWAWRRRSALVGGVAAGAGAVMLASTIIGNVPGVVVERESVMLSESWILGWHVGAMLLAYSSALVGAVGGMLCLLGVRTRGIIRAAVRLTFWAMTIGILLGALWADTAWGRWWAWDAKETWSLVTWCICLAALHACTRVDPARESSGREERGLAVLAILVLGGVLWTFLGVNLLMRSLHAYAG